MADRSLDEILESLSETKGELERMRREKEAGSRTVDKSLKQLNSDLESLAIRSKLGESRGSR
jgi:hypothetical protein